MKYLSIIILLFLTTCSSSNTPITGSYFSTFEVMYFQQEPFNMKIERRSVFYVCQDSIVIFQNDNPGEYYRTKFNVIMTRNIGKNRTQYFTDNNFLFDLHGSDLYVAMVIDVQGTKVLRYSFHGLKFVKRGMIQHKWK